MPADTPEEAEPEVTYASGPEGDIDQLADEEAWVYDGELYESASKFVDDICQSLPGKGVAKPRPQWLAEGGYLNGDGQAILEAGIPKLCPKWSKTLKKAASGDYDQWLSAKDYEVKADPELYNPDSGSDVREAAPGSYRATGVLEDCYWERTTKDGEIIDNQFATQAREITVTLRAGELFTSKNCGSWAPVK